MAKGEIFGIIGESGAGKTMLSKALLGLVPYPGIVTVDQLQMQDEDVPLSAASFAKVRGKKITMITQDPFLALDPVMKVGKQIAESFMLHQNMTNNEALNAAAKMLAAVKLQHDVINKYPHQLSGGMAQRVVIAMMLACKPQILIADEVTSALDADTRAEVMRLLVDLAKNEGISIILISHDIHQVVAHCDRILVMWQGSAIECTTAEKIFMSKHPYTAALLNCLPSKAKRGTLLPEFTYGKILESC